MTMPPPTIEYAVPADAARCHQISHASFGSDAHTLFKVWEKGATDSSGEMPLDLIQGWIERPNDKCAVIKAVADDGTILGWSAWGLVNLDGSRKAVRPGLPFARGFFLCPQDPSDPALEPVDAQINHPDFPDDPTLPLLDQLKNITSGHLFTMSDRLTPPGSKVIITQSIAVDPAHQNHGVGKLMVKWATDLADQHGASMWCHLADNPVAVSAFARHGFKEVSPCAVDLDKYATKEMPQGREKWGTYTFHCMVREPKAVEA